MPQNAKNAIPALLPATMKSPLTHSRLGPALRREDDEKSETAAQPRGPDGQSKTVVSSREPTGDTDERTKSSTSGQKRPRSAGSRKSSRKRPRTTRSAHHGAGTGHGLPNHVLRTTWSPDVLPKHYNGTYKCQYTFYSFSICAIQLKNVRVAVAHVAAMKEVKRLVQARLNEVLIAGRNASRKDFVEAAGAAVAEVRGTHPSLAVGAWRFFSKIEPQPGTGLKAVRSNMTGDLTDALNGWSRICESEGVTDVSALAGLEVRRKAADSYAAHVLENLRPGAFPKDSSVLGALRLWRFEKNVSRENVRREGVDWVYSDTFGLIKDRADQKLKACQTGVGYESFQRLLYRWARGRQLSHLRNHPLPYTTISVNKGFAAKLHRDTRNEGPSVALALGEFTGGGLRYWPGDSKRGDVESLRGQPSIVFDMRSRPAVFDGNCGHEVEDFQGERFSLVFFTVQGYEKADCAARRAVRAVSGNWPTAAALRRLHKQVPQPT